MKNSRVFLASVALVFGLLAASLHANSIISSGSNGVPTAISCTQDGIKSDGAFFAADLNSPVFLAEPPPPSSSNTLFLASETTSITGSGTDTGSPTVEGMASSEFSTSSKASFFEAVAVPDNGSTLLLFGSALALVALAKKRRIRGV